MSDIRPSDPVTRLLNGPVATIRPSATLREAAEALAADAVGLLVVVDHRGLVGVLSERDIVAGVADYAELDVERVSERVSDNVVSIEERSTVLEAAAAMADAEIRHLAVTRNGEVTGVVSIRDVVAVLTAG